MTRYEFIDEIISLGYREATPYPSVEFNAQLFRRKTERIYISQTDSVEIYFLKDGIQNKEKFTTSKYPIALKKIREVVLLDMIKN